jgi:hypothetical protein
VEDFNVLVEFPFAFYGALFTVGLGSDRKLWLPFPLLCGAIGVDVDGQVQRVRRDEVFAGHFQLATFAHYPYGEEDFRARQVLALRLDMLPYWLGGIDTARIADDATRANLVRFKKEFAAAAWSFFRSEILGETELAELVDAGAPPGEQQYNALMDRAAAIRRQLLEEPAARHQQQDEKIASLDQRLSLLEARLLATNTLNTKQMKQAQDMIAILARALEKKGRTGTYAEVHQQVKNEFQVPSYTLIPEADYPRLRRFLAGWYRTLVKPGAQIPSIFSEPDQRSLF